MSPACRQEDGITHDRVSLAGKQTKRRRRSGGRTPERDGARHRHRAHRVQREPSQVKSMLLHPGLKYTSEWIPMIRLH